MDACRTREYYREVKIKQFADSIVYNYTTIHHYIW